jgi:hypothetical protein
MYDADWNPSYNTQAMGRIHRPGQTKPCHIYRLVTCGTVDEVMILRGFGKGNLAAANGEDDSGGGSKLSKEEKKECFNPDHPGDESRACGVMDWTEDDTARGKQLLAEDKGVGSNIADLCVSVKDGKIGDAKKTEDELEDAFNEYGEAYGSEDDEDEEGIHCEFEYEETNSEVDDGDEEEEKDEDSEGSMDDFIVQDQQRNPKKRERESDSSKTAKDAKKRVTAIDETSSDSEAEWQG